MPWHIRPALTFPWAAYVPIVYVNLNPLDMTAGMVLTNNTLTATASSNSTYQLARSVTSRASGKWVFAFDPLFLSAVVGDYGAGVANATHVMTTYVGSDNHSIGSYADGRTWRGGVQQIAPNAVTDFSAASTEVMIAVDIDNARYWVREGAGNWNNNGAADPAANVGGIDMSALTGPFFATVNLWTTNDSMTVNLGGTAFGNAAPSGFTAWNN